MNLNLAFYGTLRDPDVLRFVTHNELTDRFHKSISVQGWACLRIEGEAYPLLRSDPGASTIFHLYHDCSEVSWRRLLEYEGSEYGFSVIEIEGHSYRIFMAEACVVASSEVWNLETFQSRDKIHYLNQLLGLST